MRRNPKPTILLVLTLFIDSFCTTSSVFAAEPPAQDGSILNQSQLSYLVYVATAELDIQLPGGAAEQMHEGEENNRKNAADYTPVCFDQLKRAAKPIYDRLIEIGYTDDYPWAGSLQSKDDKAPVTIEQAKHLFVFDLNSVDPTHDSDGDGLPDWWKWYYFGSWYGMEGTTPDEDWDGDGISNAQEYINGTDPTDEYNGSPPKLLIVGGGNQRDVPGTKLRTPLAVGVDDPKYDNVPITFRVTSGGALLIPTVEDARVQPPVAELIVPANEPTYGKRGAYRAARVSIILPAEANDTSVIEICAMSRAGIMKVSTTAITAVPSIPTPRDFKTTSISPVEATLSWTPVDPALQTTIEASKDECATWFTLAVVAPGIHTVTVTGLEFGEHPFFYVYAGGGKPTTESTKIQWPFPSTEQTTYRRWIGKLWRQQQWRCWNEAQKQEPAVPCKAPVPFLGVVFDFSNPLECSIIMDVHTLLTDNGTDVHDHVYNMLRTAWGRTTDAEKTEINGLLANQVIKALTAPVTANERWISYSSLRGRACTLAGLLKLGAAAPALVQLLKPLPGQIEGHDGYHHWLDPMPGGFTLDSPAISPLIQIGTPAEPALWEELYAHRDAYIELMLQSKASPPPSKHEATDVRAERRKGSYILYLFERMNSDQ